MRIGMISAIGMLWILFATAVSKCASLIAQVVLGWQLTIADFGLYALALSVSTSVSMLRNGGTQQLLVQKGDEYKEIASGIFKFSLIFNCVACLILIILSQSASIIFNAPELQAMIVLIALSIVLRTPNVILRAKLAIDHRFKEISIVGIASNVFRQGGTIAFALLGFGYMSFVWPIMLEPVVVCVLSYSFVREWPKGVSLTKSFFKKTFYNTRWIMLGSLALAMSTSGQYFVIGLFEDKKILGIYFFGFQLVIAVSVLITNAIETVFLPIMSRISTGENQYKKIYVNTLYSICLASIIITVLLYFNIETLVRFTWKGKWDEAIIIIQILVLTIPALLFATLNKVVMESKGLWGKRLVNLSIFVVGDILVAGVCAWKYDIYFTALMVCLYRNLFSLAQCLWITKIVKISLKRTLNAIVPNFYIVLSFSIFTVIYIDNISILNVSYSLKKLTFSCFIVLILIITNLFFEWKQIKKSLYILK